MRGYSVQENQLNIRVTLFIIMTNITKKMTNKYYRKCMKKSKTASLNIFLPDNFWSKQIFFLKRCNSYYIHTHTHTHTLLLTD